MVVCLAIYAVFITILLLLYVFFDVNYFLRVAFVMGRGKLFESKKRIDECTEIYGLCTTQDIDIVFKHMNNARYIRELDFARFHFYDRTGLYKEIIKANGNVLQTASNIRYRRTIPLLSTYKITTKLIFWDKTNLFMEQQFVTLSDNFVRAIILSKQSIIGINLPEVLGKLTGKDVAYRPTPLPELEDWIKSIEKSSARLKKKN
ncbi:protein THEM6 [Euwallacea fornicatus]|uniref:protein THEM6 n=1 Tax=Euwallacea fornicatus TaxID=995702 RepID=UPI0033904B12